MTLTTQCHIPEDFNPEPHNCQNITFRNWTVESSLEVSRTTVHGCWSRRFWCSYILFIIIIWGILVLYIYIYIYIYIYKTRLASNETFSPSNKINREVGRAKDLSAPRYLTRHRHRLALGRHWTLRNYIHVSCYSLEWRNVMIYLTVRRPTDLFYEDIKTKSRLTRWKYVHYKPVLRFEFVFPRKLKYQNHIHKHEKSTQKKTAKIWKSTTPAVQGYPGGFFASFLQMPIILNLIKISFSHTKACIRLDIP